MELKNTNITDEEKENFIENQKLICPQYEYYTPVKTEITMIAHLITDKQVRENLLSYLDDKMFNVDKMQDILKDLKACKNEEDDLSEYLINKGHSARDIKCILSFKNDSYDSLHLSDMGLFLHKYKIIRYYAPYYPDKDRDVHKFLHKVVSDKSFYSFTGQELLNYLDEFLEREEYKYKLKKDYKELSDSTELDFSKVFGLFAEIEKGVDMPFPIINDCIRGVRRGQLFGIGMLSNSGKTRFLVNLVTHLIFNEDEKVLLILNETTEQDLMYCIATTAINNPIIQEKYNLSKTYTEREFRNRQIPYYDVYNVEDYIKEKIKDNLIPIITDSYTDSDLKNMIIQEHYRNKADYIFYDTLKVSSESTNTTDDLKKTATTLYEMARKYNLFIGCSFQLTDETRKAKAENLSSLNIANSKQVYHVMNTVLLFKEIDKKDYSNYLYTTAENKSYNLNEDVRYYVCNLDKNRIGDKPKLVFEVDLDSNTWKEVGKLKIK